MSDKLAILTTVLSLTALLLGALIWTRGAR
jgi:hypothetical protein